MKCKLCEKEIVKYDKMMNHLVIDDSHEADLCGDCVHKIINWHGETLAKLFPTKAMKKRFMG